MRVAVLLVAALALVVVADAIRVAATPTPTPEALAATDPAVKAAKQSEMLKKMKKKLAADMPPDFSKMKSVKELLRDRFEEARLKKVNQQLWTEWGKTHKQQLDDAAQASQPDPKVPRCKDCKYLPAEPVDPKLTIADIPVPFTKGPILYVDEDTLNPR